MFGQGFFQKQPPIDNRDRVKCDAATLAGCTTAAALSDGALVGGLLATAGKSAVVAVGAGVATCTFSAMTILGCGYLFCYKPSQEPAEAKSIVNEEADYMNYGTETRQMP